MKPEAVLAKMAVRYNIHMDNRVMEVADFKSKAKLDI